MRHRVAQLLVEQFDKSPQTAWDVTGVNVALYQVMQAPYFRDNYKETFELTQQGPELFCLTFHPKSSEFDIQDPLAHKYSGWYDYDDEDEEPEESTIIKDRLVFRQAQHLPSQAKAYGEKYLQTLPQDMLNTLFHPQDEDFQHKDRLMISVMGPNELNDFMVQLLGPDHNYTLQDEGIKYHRPDWCRNEEWMFVVAHNQHEVAGVMAGYTHNDSWYLSYVSVCPQFRQRGVSNTLYQKVIDHCVSRELILVRSNASEFSQELGITSRYDALLNQSRVVHCVTSTYIENALQEAKGSMPYKDLVALSSTLTSRQEGDWEHAEHIKKVATQYAQHAPQRRPSMD